MNVITSSKMREGLKAIRKLFIWGIVFLLITVGFAVWSYFVHVRDVDPITMNSAIVNQEGAGTYASIEVASFPYAFAEYDNTTDKYYFVFDKNDLMYITYLSEVDYDRLYENATEDNPIIITGMTSTIPDDVKKLAIQIYNEDSEEEFLTEENFEEYLGTIYLNTLEHPNDPTLQIICAVVFGCIGIGFIIGGIVVQKKTQKKVQSFDENEWKKIESELEDSSTISYRSLKLYFTEHYIVNLTSGIDVFSYDDILWMYPFLIKQYGITTNKSIILVTKDKVRHQVSNVNNFSKKSKQNYDDIMSFIYDKNQKITVGYTKENIQQMNDLYGIK